ncbi:MAG: hypothetical protein EOP83_14025 [Verrucomicrobiaceae bacterium]|nr:MAG: hypothetical protein EOP83_14025 [Verrucomicrobiaceae bacterium]
MSLDFITLELVRQLPGIIYSMSCIFASILLPMAALHGIKAYCAAFSPSARRHKDNKPGNTNESR